MTQDTTGLTVAATIAARRTATMPCIDDDCIQTRRLLDQRVRTGMAEELVACGCGRTWRRLWIGGYR